MAFGRWGTAMANRKLLLLTYHFPPSAASGSFRMLGFARHLRKFGWDPVVVAPPSLPWEPVDPDLGRQVPEQTRLYRVPYPWKWYLKPLRRFAPYALWLPPAFLGCRRAIRAERPDVILTSSPPHRLHLLGASLKRLYRLPWVVDFRDPWIQHPLSGAVKSNAGWWTTRLEKTVMRQAEAVVGNAPLACAALQRAYPEHDGKIVAIMNGYDPDAFDTLGAPGSARSYIHVVHTGQVYAGRDPRPFLDALQAWPEHPASRVRPIRVSFVGREGKGGLDLGQEVTARGLGEIVRLGEQVSYAQSLREMAEADVLLLLDSPGRRVGVPAKFYEYLGARRPILALAEPDGDLAWALRESGVPHRIARPMDVSAITRALTELLEAGGGASPLTRLVQREVFTRERMAQRLATLLDTLPSRSSRLPRKQAQKIVSPALES